MLTYVWRQVRWLLGKKEMLAIIFAQYTQRWGLYGLLYWTPSYIQDKFQVSVSEMAHFTVMPYVLQAAVCLVAGS